MNTQDCTDIFCFEKTVHMVWSLIVYMSIRMCCDICLANLEKDI